LLSSNNIYDEKALLGRVSGGDEEAFRQIFHHYNRMLQPFVVKLTHSDHAAEEVLQEVFLKLWLHRERLSQIDNPRAYIIRIVSNESMNYLRGLAKDNRLFEKIRFSAAESPFRDSPEQFLSYRETERRIHEAIEQLPVACKKIYRMSREQDKRIPEIAAELQLSNSTVKNQLVKALKIIKLYVSHTALLLVVGFFSKF
jgi:RNA polymerase sigma-70 factor (family 1)